MTRQLLLLSVALAATLGAPASAQTCSVEARVTLPNGKIVVLGPATADCSQPAPEPTPEPEPTPPPPPSGQISLAAPIKLQSGQTFGPATIAPKQSSTGGWPRIFDLSGTVANATIRNVVVTGRSGEHVVGTAGSSTNTVTDLTIDGLEIPDAGRYCLKFRGSGQRITVSNVRCVRNQPPATSMSNMPIGLVLFGNYDGVTVRDSSFSGFTMNISGYDNGDGIATERESKNLTLENVEANDNTDAGFDLKTAVVRGDNLRAAGNGRNFRFWGDDVQLGTVTCGNFKSACIWTNGTTTGQQTVRIRKLVVRMTEPHGGLGAILQGNANTVRTIFIIGECDIQAPAGTVFSKGLSGKSQLGPGCRL